MLLQAWFLVIAAVSALTIVVRGVPSVEAALALAAIALAPPIMLLALWPGLQPPTASEVMRGIDRRD